MLPSRLSSQEQNASSCRTTKPSSFIQNLTAVQIQPLITRNYHQTIQDLDSTTNISLLTAFLRKQKRLMDKRIELHGLIKLSRWIMSNPSIGRSVTEEQKLQKKIQNLQKEKENLWQRATISVLSKIVETEAFIQNSWLTKHRSNYTRSDPLNSWIHVH